ncbi:MAG: hypothetical protein V1793_02805 [Pseudomonadota bacterium]
MTEEQSMNQCNDPTKSLTIEIPCRLVQRAERYAQENNQTLAGLVIEALDSFLRTQK